VRSEPMLAMPRTRRIGLVGEHGSSRVRSMCCPIQPGIAHPAFGRTLRTPICCTSARNASAPSQPNPSARPGPSGPGDPVSSFLNVRVANTAAFYADAKS